MPFTPNQKQCSGRLPLAPKKTVKNVENAVSRKKQPNCIYSKNAKHGYFKVTVGGKNPSSYFQTYKSQQNGSINYNAIVKSVANQIKNNQRHVYQQTRKKHLQQLKALVLKHKSARQESLRPNSNTSHTKAYFAAKARANGVNKAMKNLNRYRQLFF